MTDFFTVEEAAAKLRCSRRRIFELLADGTLIRGKRYGKRTVIVAESVSAALEVDPIPAPAPRRKSRARPDLAAVMDAVKARARRPIP